MKEEETYSDSFRHLFEKRLEKPSFADAKETWVRLQQQGCEATLLLEGVRLYCSHKQAQKDHSEQSEIADFLDGTASTVREAEKQAEAAEQLASEIEEVDRNLEIRRASRWWDDADTEWWDDTTSTLPNVLRTYASLLRRAAIQIRSPFDLRDQPGQLLNYLEGYIKKATGKNGEIDLANLIRVGYAVLGFKGPRLEELGFKVAHFGEDSLDADVGRAIRRARGRLKKRQMEDDEIILTSGAHRKLRNARKKRN